MTDNRPLHELTWSKAPSELIKQHVLLVFSQELNKETMMVLYHSPEQTDFHTYY